MTPGNDLSSQFALDVKSVQKLKYSAANAPGASLKEAARQFEAVFLQMMLKSMREASPQSGLLQSQQRDVLTSMQDQQWSQHLAGHGFGLAEQLVKQLEGSGLPGTDATAKAVDGAEDVSALMVGIPRGAPRLLQAGLAMPAPREEASPTVGQAAGDDPAGAPAAGLIADVADAAGRFSQRAAHVATFVAQLAEPARQAEAVSGVPAELILAQAALETGWGRREIPTATGGNSHNLFGIKAGSSWQGPTAAITTTEYVDGRPVTLVDRFRVYDSYADAFADYANLIGNNPRYRHVLEADTPQQAARALQEGGYATDPRYADKLGAIMSQLDMPIDAPSESGSERWLAGAERMVESFDPARVPTSIF